LCTPLCTRISTSRVSSTINDQLPFRRYAPRSSRLSREKAAFSLRASKKRSEIYSRYYVHACPRLPRNCLPQMAMRRYRDSSRQKSLLRRAIDLNFSLTFQPLGRLIPPRRRDLGGAPAAQIVCSRVCREQKEEHLSRPSHPVRASFVMRAPRKRGKRART